MSADIHKWWASGFDLDAADSSRTVDIVGIPVESVFVVSVFAVLGFAVSVFVEAVTAVSFDAVYAGLRPRPTAQV